MNDNEVIQCRAIKTKPTHQNCMYRDTSARVAQILQDVIAICGNYEVDKIVIESPSFSSKGNATRTICIAYGMFLEGLAFPHAIQWVFIPPASLKKFATGNGTADKKSMLAAIQEHDYQLWELLDSNTVASGKFDKADAYWLACYGYTK